MAIASLFASCDDDDNNTNVSGTTVEFADATYSANENGGVFQIPVTVKGLRNGDIHFRVSTSETGENPAKEEVNYMVTSKYITVKADSATSTTTYVEIKAIDDLQMTGDRTFNVTIESADGATIGSNKTTTVTIVDNDESYYSMFGGQWRFSGQFVSTGEDGVEKTEDFSYDMSISTVSDPTASGYGTNLNCVVTSFDFPSSPVVMTLTFPMRYRFMESRGNGTLELLCTQNEVFGIDQSVYRFGWTFGNYTNGSASNTAIRAKWVPTEDNSIPTEIAFDENSILAIYEYNIGLGFQYGALMKNLKITRKTN